MARIAYPSDLTDAQWRLIEKRIPPTRPGGRSRSICMREVINGILYLVRTGCSWRQLPHDFPPWGTVHWYYRCFRLDGTWPEIHDALRDRVRVDVTTRRVTPGACKGALGTWRSLGVPGHRAGNRRTLKHGTSFACKPQSRGADMSQHLSLLGGGQAAKGQAKVRAGLGKSDRPGSQGGLGKRGSWWNCEPTSQPKGRDW